MRVSTRVIALIAALTACRQVSVSSVAQHSGLARPEPSCERLPGGPRALGLARGFAAAAPSYTVTFVRVRDSAPGARAVGRLTLRRIGDTTWVPERGGGGGALDRQRQFLGGRLQLALDDLGIRFEEVPASGLEVLVAEYLFHDSLPTGRPVTATIYASVPYTGPGIRNDGDAIGMRAQEVTDQGFRGVWRADHGFGVAGGGYFCAVAP
jgi:hypothetical protein